MKLDWQTTPNSDPFNTSNDNQKGEARYTLHSLQVDDCSQDNITQALASAIETASALLDSNIDDESLFLFFEWDNASSTLTIAVTDDTKQKTSPDVVRCTFATLSEQQNAQQIQLLIKDYLSTCKQFLRFSLVAMFHTGSREHCELL